MEAEAHALFDARTAGSMVLLALGAFCIPLLCRPLRIPAAVGEILYGVLIGPHAMGLVVSSDFIRLLAELGFFLLMFIAGLELDFRRVETAGAARLRRHLLATLLVFACGFGLAMSQGFPWFLAMVLSAVSIGVPLVLLQATGLAREDFGQEILLLGSLAEFLCILVATGINAHDHAGGINASFAGELGQLAFVFVLAYAVLVVLRLAVWWKAESFGRVVETHDPSEIGVRAGLALMFVFVAVTAVLGIEPILGAFLAGALFSFVFRNRGALEVKFLSLGNGFFVPFFFIVVGLDFDLGLALKSDFGLFLKLLAALFLVRWLPLVLMQGLRQGTAGALILSAPLTLLVVLANLGLQLGLLDRAFQATILLLAVVSSTIYPFLFQAFGPRLLGRGRPRST